MKSNSLNSQPNLLVFMTDQQRFDCIGANGNSLIQTPNLDELIKESANMQNCFVQAPVCVPSRQTFLQDGILLLIKTA